MRCRPLRPEFLPCAPRFGTTCQLCADTQVRQLGTVFPVRLIQFRSITFLQQRGNDPCRLGDYTSFAYDRQTMRKQANGLDLVFGLQRIKARVTALGDSVVVQPHDLGRIRGHRIKTPDHICRA